jgi:hypothetical protein
MCGTAVACWPIADDEPSIASTNKTQTKVRMVTGKPLPLVQASSKTELTCLFDAQREINAPKAAIPFGSCRPLTVAGFFVISDAVVMIVVKS